MFWISIWRLYLSQVLAVGTSVLYTKCIICMLHVWVHCAGISYTIACYVIGQSFLIVIVNLEFYIIIFIVRDLVFQTWIVSAELNSGCFFAVHGEFDWRICHSLMVCSQLWYGSSTWIRNLKLVLGTLIFDWEPTYLLMWSKQVLL